MYDQYALIAEIKPYLDVDERKSCRQGYVRCKCPFTDHDTDDYDYHLGINENGFASGFCYACGKGGNIRKTYEALKRPFPPEGVKNVYAIYGNPHVYRDAYGNAICEKIKKTTNDPNDSGKRWRHYDPHHPDADNNGYVWHLEKTNGGRIKPGLYNRHLLQQHKGKDALVIITEGESDADALTEIEIIATTSPHGAMSFKTEYTKSLKTFKVVVMQDNDGRGHDGCLKTAHLCHEAGLEIKICPALGEEKGYDTKEWIEDQRKARLDDTQIKEKFLELINALPPFNPKEHPELSETNPKGRGKGATFDIRMKTKYTDDGISDLFCDQYRKTIRWCDAHDRWLIWDGNRWRISERTDVYKYVLQTVKTLKDDIHPDMKTNEREAIQKVIQQNLQTTKVKNILTMAQHKMSISTKELDKKEIVENILNAQNGIIDLSTGRLLLPDPELFITMIIPFDYPQELNEELEVYPINRYENEVPLFSKTIDEFCCGNTDLKTFLLKWFAQGLIANNSPKKIICLLGRTNTGKTILLQLVSNLLGSDYAGKFNVNLLCRTKFGGQAEGVTPGIAKFEGKRFMYCSEAGKSNFDTAKIKDMTGGDKLVANPKHKAVREFPCTFTIFVDTNNMPSAYDGDEAFFKRWWIIPCENHITDDQIDTDLPQKLINEAPGILKILVQHYILSQKEGLNPPECVLEASSQYQKSTDSILAWLSETDSMHIKISRKGRSKTRDAWKCHSAWAEINGEHHFDTMKAFKDAMGKTPRTVGKTEIIWHRNFKGVKGGGWSGVSVISGYPKPDDVKSELLQDYDDDEEKLDDATQLFDRKFEEILASIDPNDPELKRIAEKEQDDWDYYKSSD